MEKGQDIASELFNSLPSDLKTLSNYGQFCTEVKTFLKMCVHQYVRRTFNIFI